MSNAPKAPNTVLTFTPNNGTFVYCNNPEQLFDSDLGDHAPRFGNHYLLWSLVTGECQAYYSHENMTGRTIGYGLQIYNPNVTTISVRVTGVGFGNNAFTCWTQFFNKTNGGGGTVGTFTVKSKEALWIQRNDNAIPPGAIFNGAVGFDVSGGSVYVFNYAYDEFANIDGTATYLGYVTRIDPSGQNEAHVYKGTATGFIAATALNKTISSLLQQSAAWQTNDCPGSDMASITCPLTDTDNPTYTTFMCVNGDNLGNWGIRNAYALTVTNDTTRSRTVNLVVAQPYFFSNVFVEVMSSTGGCAINKSNWKYYSFKLVPGESRTVTFQVILSGSSYGGLVNSIVVK